MSDSVICLDTDVVLKFLIVEHPPELSDAATQLVYRAITSSRLIAPAFAWAEVGSVLRKKVRLHQITSPEAEAFWADYLKLPIQYIDSPALRARAWKISQQFNLPALYDAAFLACIEIVQVPEETTREFWTADKTLMRTLGIERPSHAYLLGGTSTSE